MLSYARYLEVLGDECGRFVELAGHTLKTPIATCPGWTMEDLCVHLADVYRHWSTQLLARDPSAKAAVSPIRERGDVIDGVEREGAVLIECLSRTDEDAPCWNWSDADYTAYWVARRMALETAIHRVDAGSATKRHTAIAEDIAIDGIEEKFDVHLPLDLRDQPTASLSGTICLICADNGVAWTLGADRGRLRVRDGRGPASVALVGAASDLFQFVWNRADLNRFDVTGDQEVARNWRNLPC